MRNALKSLLPKPVRRLLWACWTPCYEAYRGALHWGRVLPRYGGLRYRCPFCGGRWRRMLPRGVAHRDRPVIVEQSVVGMGYRDNSVCPACFSFDRERLLWLFIRRRTDWLKRPVRLLHIAPEPNLANRLSRAPSIEYVSGDLEPGVGMMKLDVTRLPFDDGRFDVIICNHVLEHVPDEEAALRELARVLAAGGQALLQVPYSTRMECAIEDPSLDSAEARARAFGQEDHVRLYGRDFSQRLSRYGLDAEVVERSSFLKRGESDTYGLLVDENVVIYRKPDFSSRADR